MNKHLYIETFNLIYKKVLELSIGNKVEQHLEIRKKLCVKDLDDHTIFKRLVAVILSSGFNATIVKNKWNDLKKEFQNFDFLIIKDWDHEKVEELMVNEKIIRNKNKLKAIIYNAAEFNKIIIEYGSFDNYLTHFSNHDILYHDVKDRFHFLGEITTFDFLKRIGLNLIKPDVHIRRLFYRLGWIPSKRETQKNIRKIFKIAEYISEQTSQNLNMIDGVFWLFCSGYGDVLKYDVCGARPRCNECYVKNCKYKEENRE